MFAMASAVDLWHSIVIIRIYNIEKHINFRFVVKKMTLM